VLVAIDDVVAEGQVVAIVETWRHGREAASPHSRRFTPIEDPAGGSRV